MAAARWRPVLILLCGAAVLSIAIGVRQGFGLFLPPISADRGWRPTSGLVGQIYGTRYLATLFGVVFFSHQVGGFFGAWLGGWAFERTGSYDSMWLLSILLGVLAGLVHLPIAERALRPVPA